MTEFSEIVEFNISVRKDKTTRHCPHEELSDVRTIYRRCKCCGKFVLVPDEELIRSRGVMGKGW